MKYYFIQGVEPAFSIFILWKNGRRFKWKSKDYGRQKLINYNPKVGFQGLIDLIDQHEYKSRIEFAEIYDNRKAKGRCKGPRIRRWTNGQWKEYQTVTF